MLQLQRRECAVWRVCRPLGTGSLLARTVRMTPEQLRNRTFDFSKQIIQFTGPLLQQSDTADIVRQLRRAACSVSSNYRAAGRARTRKEFTAKIGVVREEADEALYWLLLLRDCSLAVGAELDTLASEAEELVKIFVKSYATANKKSGDVRSNDRPK